MTDRELLMLAAKAADITVVGDVRKFIVQPDVRYENGFIVRNDRGGDSCWNPLTDDGDALRLAVKLYFDIHFLWDGADDQYYMVRAYTHGARADALEEIGFKGDRGQIDECAATRRAIVRAAAEIGRGK